MVEFAPHLRDLPGDVPTLLSIAKSLSEQRLHDDAAAACQRVLALDPRCAQARFLLAVVAHQQRQADEAVRHAQRALEIEPKYPEAEALIARVQAERGDFTAALVHAVAALKLDSQAAGAWAIRGCAEYELGDARLAAASFEQASALSPEKWEYWFGCGAAYQAQGKWPEAVRAFYRVIELRPALAHAHYRLGCIFLELQRTAEANLAFETSAQLNPARDFVSLFRAIALLGRQELAGAATILEGLKAAHPESGPVALILGEVELRQAHFDTALQLLQEAQRLDPGMSASYYKAGVALRGAGRDWEALFELQESLRHNPAHGPAQLELNELYLTLADPALFEVQPPSSPDLPVGDDMYNPE